MTLKLDQKDAVNIVIALINQGKIELPCLRKFNEFRAWELDEAKQDSKKASNATWDEDLIAKKNSLCKLAASLDAEYLKTLVEVLTSDRSREQQTEDAWEFLDNLRIKNRIDSIFSDQSHN